MIKAVKRLSGGMRFGALAAMWHPLRSLCISIMVGTLIKPRRRLTSKSLTWGRPAGGRTRFGTGDVSIVAMLRARMRSSCSGSSDWEPLGS